MLNINTLLEDVPHVTPKYAKILKKMRLKTVRDFLLYLPFRYDDFSKIVPLSSEYLDQTITTEGRLIKTKNFRAFQKKMTITEIIVQDRNNTPLKAVWFNQPFILDSLRKNMAIRLSGKLSQKGNFFQMINPAWEKADRDATNTGRLVPIYSETVGITSRWIRWQMKSLLPLAQELPDIIPPEILKKYHLDNIYTALAQLHFPDSHEKLIRAQKRIAFEEMFLTQTKALQIKKERQKKNSLKITFDEKLIKNFVKHLKFKLTGAQRKASFEILKDLEKSQPMNRLLNGDVGSGKTIVATIAILQTLANDYQATMMAPTEILARQHFESLCELFKNYNFNLALLTNSYKLFFHSKQKKTDPVSREDLLKNIADGKINFVIGTHALIQKDVAFKKLALIIIDEQHRFGVTQRATLQDKTMKIKGRKKTTAPHLLTMTATPIPRTLAIAYFGSLSLSLLDEMPQNRKKIITRVVAPKKQMKIYAFVESEIKKGYQAFVILPLVEESDATTMREVKAAIVEHKRLSEKVFPKFKVGLLHGRLKAKEKEKTMKDFQNKKIDILVSTSVVEVGIDIPNATVMIIENAERFGLSQLHQFRGRIGRGKHQSYCFLFSQSSSPRLKTMQETNNGFEIAEQDLKLRGPGQFLGTIQSGLPDIAMKNLSNIKLIKFARAEAQEILKVDPKLKEHPALQGALKKFSENVHLE